MKPVTCAQWYRPFMIEMTAMMRRNVTRRRVQTFSSDSIRSDDIPAMDIALSRSLALSRAASRADTSDIAIILAADLGIGVQRVLESSHDLMSWPARTAKSIADEM